MSVHFKAIIESYDNLATLRTEDPRRHRLKLYFAPEMADEVNALLKFSRGHVFDSPNFSGVSGITAVAINLTT